MKLWIHDGFASNMFNDVDVKIYETAQLTMFDVF
jgi:hypothetical protein